MAEGTTTVEQTSPAAPSLAAKLLVTIALPVVLLVVGAYVSLPGVPAMFTQASHVSASSRTTSVFALGILPVLNAFWLVEVVAFLVPPLSRLRHHPDGRAKLDRASRVLAIVLAGFQGWGMSLSLQALVHVEEMRGADLGPISAPVVTATLVGGVCVQMVAAELISRRGLFNGYLVLFGGAGVVTLFEDAKKLLLGRGAFEDLPLGRFALACFSAACVVAATVIVLRGAAHVRAKTAAGDEAVGAPYREARALALSPALPIPSSSLQPAATALALGAFPATLASLDVGVGPTYLADKGVMVLLMLVVASGLAILFARLLHRPKELASLVEQMGAKAGDAFGAEMKDARREVLLPTLLFLFAVVVAHATATFAVMLLVPLVAIAMDAFHALRTASKVPVWEERRVAAVPLLRAVLAAEGIATETRGAAFATLWQVFAPYAPVEILVDPSDIAPARALLRHLVAGDPSPERGTGRAPVPYGALAWPAKRRVFALGACIVLAAALWAARAMPSHVERGPTPAEPRAVLEIVRVDDTVDPLDGVDLSLEGIEIRVETIQVGPDRPPVTRHYAWLPLRVGDSIEVAEGRLRSALATVPSAAGHRFGMETSRFGTEGLGGYGARSYVLTGPSAIEPDDILEAIAVHDQALGAPHVAITFGPEGAKRFAEVTRAWNRRRIALLVDGRVYSAPIIREPITGGRVSLDVGKGPEEEQWKEAQRLARALGGR